MSDWQDYYTKGLQAHINELETSALEQNQLLHRSVDVLKEQATRIKVLEGVVEAARFVNIIMDDVIEYLKLSDDKGKRIHHNLVKAKDHLVSMILDVYKLEEV